MICALCNEKEANKKNTHFLTDAIIRSCLNQDGSQARERGFYFDLSGNTPFVEFNFQRGTTIEYLEKSLGRLPTEQEIENAKTIPFSVDNVFCGDCESIFTEIEGQFIETILPKLRNSDLSTISILKLEDVKLLRLFFYLQVWRTAVCDQSFFITNKTLESLRTIILNNKDIETSEIFHFPISITYLQTTGGEKEYTSNFVGYTSDRFPNIIFMNDIVIQFFESIDQIQFFDFYKLNDEDYREYINLKESQFIVRVFQNDRRKQFYHDLSEGEKVKNAIDFFSEKFSLAWTGLFGFTPPNSILQEYINFITKGSEYHILKYSPLNVIDLTKEFLEKKLANR